jgi:hypothetical protein
MEQSSEQSSEENWELFRSKASLSRRNLEIKNDNKRIPCRYGHGCTHIQDPLHLERFTHPPIPLVDGLILSDCFSHLIPQLKQFEPISCVMNAG